MMSRKERHKRTVKVRIRRRVILILIPICAVCLTLLVWSGYGASAVEWVIGKANTEAKPQVQPITNRPEESRTLIKQNVGKKFSEGTIQVEQWLQKLTLDEKIGQMLLVNLSALAEERPSTPVSQLVSQLAPGGVILFKDDIKSVEQTITANVQMLRSSPLPLWIGVDQEGGAVNRIPFVSDWNGNMAIAATGEPQFAAATAIEMGKTLQLLFCNMNFAPVADVNDDPYNPVIGLRSFGSEPEQVSAFIRAYIRGAHESGMPAIVKHFPGHGSTRTDSHVGLPKLPYTLKRFQQVEWLPFKAAIEEGADMIMSAHIQVPQLEPKTASSQKNGSAITLPATLSSRVLTEILRNQLNFQGVIITDALNMKAIADNFGSDEAAVMSIQAGADILLMPLKPYEAVAAIRKAVANGILSEERIDESVRRILQLKLAYKVMDAKRASQTNVDQAIEKAKSYFASNQADELMDRIAEHAITRWGTHTSSTQPHELITSAMSKVLLVGHDGRSLELMQGAMQAELMKEAMSAYNRATSSATKNVSRRFHTVTYEIGKLKDKVLANHIRSADAVIIVTNDVYRQPRSVKAITGLLAQLKQQKKPVAVIAAGLPYDVQVLAEAPLGYAIYGPTDRNMRLAARMLFGRASALGQLPVTIK